MGVIDKTFTADEIKKRFTRQAYFDGHIIASESEYLMKPDLFTITRDLKTSEYEIKVSLSDLRKELLYIETVIADEKAGLVHEANDIPFLSSDEVKKLDRERKISTYDNKYRKHRFYLYGCKKLMERSLHRPNRFYFLIPKYLYEIEKERIDAIPFYGVVDALTFFSLKRCTPIHKGVIDASAIWHAAQNIQGRYLNSVAKGQS